MTTFTPVAGLAGGILIGLSAVLLMASAGRIAGLSGIFGSLLTLKPDAEYAWRALFIVGLLAGAAAATWLGYFDPASLGFSGGSVVTAIGGLIVGCGTALGTGCTSGHGICGLSLFSARSIAATCTFMAVAVATVFVVRHVIGG